MKTNMKITRFAQLCFIGFQSVMTIGFIGKSFIVLEQPMMIIVGLMLLIVWLYGFYDWYVKQSQQTHPLNKAQTLSCFISSIGLTVSIIVTLLIGVWL
jgi:hypothetical protein